MLLLQTHTQPKLNTARHVDRIRNREQPNPRSTPNLRLRTRRAKQPPHTTTQQQRH